MRAQDRQRAAVRGASSASIVSSPMGRDRRMGAPRHQSQELRVSRVGGRCAEPEREPATPSLPRDHREQLCGPPFPRSCATVAGKVMGSLSPQLCGLQLHATDLACVPTWPGGAVPTPLPASNTASTCIGARLPLRHHVLQHQRPASFPRRAPRPADPAVVPLGHRPARQLGKTLPALEPVVLTAALLTAHRSAPGKSG